jgi:hypothetical protein
MLYTYYFAVYNADPKNSGQVNLSGTRNKDFEQFVLPINPSNLTISLPFAINVTPTTRGVFEEHNGIVFRNIAISGTTGVTPRDKRGNVSQAKVVLPNAIIQTLAPSTSAVINSTPNAFNKLKQIATDNLAAVENKTPDTSNWYFGHAQLHLLANYLVSYAEYKKNPKNTNARLLFVSEKDNTAYIVTPISFEFNKSAESPMLFTYKIILKAWDMANLSNTRADSIATHILYGYGGLESGPAISRMVNTLKEARAVIARYSDAIKGVASDFESSFSVANQVLLVVKETGTLGRTLADFPELAKDKFNYLSKDLSAKLSGIAEATTGNSNTQINQNLLSSTTALSPLAKNLDESNAVNNPSSSPINNDPSDKQYQDQLKFDTNNPFNNFSGAISNVDLLDEYPLSSIALSSEDQLLINTKIDAVMQRSIKDYDAIRLQIEKTRDAYADSRGLSDVDYDAAAGRVNTYVNPQTPTSADLLIIKSFNDFITAIDAITCTNDNVRKYIPDPFIRAQNIAGDSGIVIVKANSAQPIPFPYNGTLEGLASTYLDDPDRWIEIAILNDLKTPYIDEVGFYNFFTTSGNGNAFTIADATNLFLNQEVFLSSLAMRSERRLIVSIKQLGVSNYLITVDGDDDLSNFTVVQQAKMQAYLPNTINSNKIIYIPLVEIPKDSANPDVREIPAIVDLDRQERLMGVDLALTDTYDLAIGPNNDIRLSTGYKNALQAIQLKLVTEKGQLPRHLEYGTGLGIGERLDTTAKEVASDIESNLLSDPRFEAINHLTVSFEGSTVSLDIVVKCSEGAGIIPLTFKL